MLDQILSKVQSLIADWQETLGDDIQVILGGSLVSGLFILDDETEEIDVDVRFLVDNPEDEALRKRIESVTGLKYRKTRPVNDWPQGQSIGVMVEGKLNLPEFPFPLDVEGCIRNPKYVGWGRFYQEVLTEDELDEFRQLKIKLRRNKTAYKAMKEKVRQTVEQRCVARGLVTKPKGETDAKQ